MKHEERECDPDRRDPRHPPPGQEGGNGEHCCGQQRAGELEGSELGPGVKKVHRSPPGEAGHSASRTTARDPYGMSALSADWSAAMNASGDLASRKVLRTDSSLRRRERLASTRTC